MTHHTPNSPLCSLSSNCPCHHNQHIGEPDLPPAHPSAHNDTLTAPGQVLDVQSMYKGNCHCQPTCASLEAFKGTYIILYRYRYSTEQPFTPPVIHHPLAISERWDDQNTSRFCTASTRVCSNELPAAELPLITILCGVLRIPIRGPRQPTWKCWAWRYAFKFLPGERWVQDCHRVQNPSNLLNCAPQKVPPLSRPGQGMATIHHCIPMQL